MTTRALPGIAMIPAHLRFASSGYQKASAAQNQEALRAAVNALHSTVDGRLPVDENRLPESITRALLLSVLSPMNANNDSPAAIADDFSGKVDAIVEGLFKVVAEPDTRALVSVLAQHNTQLVAA